MSVIEIESAYQKLSPSEQEEFAEWYEGQLARSGPDPKIDPLWATGA